MTTETETYTPVCVLRRCGQLEGKKECCDALRESGLAKVVLDSIWQQISTDRCAQFCDGYCLSRYTCSNEQSYCYPIPVAGKRPNKLVAVMFAWYCVDVAENAAAAAADAARAAYAAYAACDAAADATYVACDAAADAAARAAAYAAARADAADAADAAARAAARAADAADAAARDHFYLDASREIERLVAAWGTPIEAKGGD